MPLDGTAVAALRSDLGGDAAALADVVQSAVAEMPSLVAQARSAAGAGDAPTLRRQVHSLKSLARMFGATALMDASLSAEQRAAAGDVPGASALLPRIEELAAEAVRDLQQLKP
jgi:HPt (histidine-containing phosphotransfer) domain-containing protein